jgi:uncharacterized protein (DUF927 family)
MRAVDAARAFIAKHGASRFEHVDDAAEDEKVINRAGFKLKEDDEWIYLILTDTWKNEVCAGLHPTRAAKALKEQELLIPDDDGRHLAAVRYCGPTNGSIRGYVIRAGILGDDEIAGDEQ